MTVQSVLTHGIRALQTACIDGAARDARLLMAGALGIDVSRLTLSLHDDIDPTCQDRFDAFIAQRLHHRPVSRILGTRLFWGRSFHITDDVLDPRGDTETLIAAALEHAGDRILDLGTGSGVIAITMAAERPTVKVVASDISKSALDVAQKNARDLGVADQLSFVQGSWFDAVTGRFDLILSNPPYISDAEMRDLAPEVLGYDPHIALTPGGDGFDPYRIIARHAPDVLTPHGAVIVEIGHAQAADVTQIFKSAGFSELRVHTDFEQKDRVITAKM
ncbi:peptide chain release factor N(5)-glutamine methyltransferase [Rhodobacteraceae bacterium]|nr:peptide chain release factor N(5)-glutamine methyltransferase [Paracoccaceae bacterium]